MTNLKLLHLYNRLVKRKMTSPLTCELCSEIVAIRITPENEPLLQCFTCGIMIHPGTKMLDKARAVVSEFYPNLKLTN